MSIEKLVELEYHNRLMRDEEDRQILKTELGMHYGTFFEEKL